MGKASGRKRDRHAQLAASQPPHAPAPGSAGVVIRLLNDTEWALHAAAVRLLQDEGLTRLEDPFGISTYPVFRRMVKEAGASFPERLRPRTTVAISADEVIGVAGVYPNMSWVEWEMKVGDIAGLDRALSRANLAMMAVAPTHRSQGTGSQLLEHAAAVARDDGYELFTGFAEGDTDALARFYSRQGMTFCAQANTHPREIFGNRAAIFRLSPHRSGMYFWRTL